MALVESDVRAPHGGPASGTSTDAIVIASTGRGASVAYAGPITARRRADGPRGAARDYGEVVSLSQDAYVARRLKSP